MIESKQTQSRDFAEIASLTREVFELAEKYHTPLVPKTYEVWFSYVCGDNPAITQRINAIIDSGDSIGSYDLDQIHADCLDGSGHEAAHLSSANAKLDRQMDDILQLIQGHIDSSADFSGSLDKEASSLSDDASPAKIRRTIEFLLTENKKMRNETAKLSDNLERSKDQIQNLRSSLETSRKNEMLDPLTRIPNRRHLEAFLTEHLEKAQNGSTTLSVVLADIDHFKRVNDEFGHLIGDEVLKYFANLMTRHIRGTDLSARYGGEEFALVFLDTDADTTMQIVERMRAEMEKARLMVTENKQPLGTITASFGVAEYRPGDDWTSLIKRADISLYAAKNGGRNRIILNEKAAA